MIVTVGRIEHLHRRPDWGCRICGRPWPCAAARGDLLEEFRVFPSVLALYMSAQMYDAVRDLIGGDQPLPEDLYERFLSWLGTGAERQQPDADR